MPFVLPPLPYAFDALEPHIDAQTMEIHHGKHHQAYVNNLNAALEHTPHAQTPIDALIAGIDELPEPLRAPVRNNGGGHANHSLFWRVMAPAGQGGGARPMAIWPARSSRTWAASMRSRTPSPRPRSPGSEAAGRGWWWARTAGWRWRAAATRTVR